MSLYSILLLAFAAVFVISWAYVAWLKLREHHNILRDEHHQPHQADYRRIWRTNPKNDQQNHSSAHSTSR